MIKSEKLSFGYFIYVVFSETQSQYLTQYLRLTMMTISSTGPTLPQQQRPRHTQIVNGRLRMLMN